MSPQIKAGLTFKYQERHQKLKSLYHGFENKGLKLFS